MYAPWHLSYNTRSISYYTKHNDSYRPFIFPVVVKKALSSVKAERQLYQDKEKAFLYVSCYCQCCKMLYFTDRGI